jgi:hypothetical protein
MFTSLGLAIFFVVANAFLGAIIGAVESTILYRSDLKWTSMLRGIALGIVGFVTGQFLAGWAGAHEAFYNGQRVDVAPWGENLWLRNRIVEHQFLLSSLLATIAVMLGWMMFGHSRNNKQRHRSNHE